MPWQVSFHGQDAHHCIVLFSFVLAQCTFHGQDAQQCVVVFRCARTVHSSNASSKHRANAKLLCKLPRIALVTSENLLRQCEGTCGVSSATLACKSTWRHGSLHIELPTDEQPPAAVIVVDVVGGVHRCRHLLLVVVVELGIVCTSFTNIRALERQAWD